MLSTAKHISPGSTQMLRDAQHDKRNRRVSKKPTSERQLLAHLEWWRAYYHFVRPHASLRVALVQPRERGGKLLAQRYRQRTPAMAAGRTNRRWTARDVLCYPLPPVPHFTR